MGYGYIKININAVKFDCIKDKDKIIFNHYIMRRENLNRIQKELPIGQFTMTVSSVAMDLEMSRGKAQRLIKEFEDKNIIKSVSKGNLSSKGYSVYQYLTSDIENNTDNDTDQYSNCKDFTHHSSKDDDIEIDNSKKENINKKLNNKETYKCVIDYLNKKTGKNFKSTTKKTMSSIEARLKEGFEEEDFYKVIDTKAKQWIHNEMNKFLRPETLFSNKFEGYLNENIGDMEADIDEIEEWDIDFTY